MKTLIVLSALLVLLIACAQQAPQQPQPSAPQQAEQPAQQQTEPMIEISNTIQILASGSSVPMELAITAGEDVTFESELAKKDTLVFKQMGKTTMENSPVIEPGATYTKTFADAGTFEYWLVGFGPKGAKIVVE